MKLRLLRHINRVIIILLVLFSFPVFVFSATTDANFTLDDSTTDSPQIIMQDEDDNTFTLQKLDDGEANIINSEGDINLKPSGDADDYISMLTLGNTSYLYWLGVLGYTNAPGFRINASTGKLEYRDEDSASWIALDDISGSGASTALSNLASVAINTSLISDTDNTDNLGSSTIGWASLFLSDAGGAPSANGQITYNTANNRFEFYQNGSVQALVSGSGDITAVGDVASGSAFTATAGDDGSTLYFEGSTADAFEVALTSADPGSDVTLTLPAATDTLVGRATTDTLTNKTLTSAVLNTGVSGTAVLDEDNMASNSATQIATQQSIKAYADTKLSDVVDDTTPQLGGQLDINGNSIGNGTLELLSFSETVSAVNELTIKNAATGDAPELQATGTDTNIDLELIPKGTGVLSVSGTTNYENNVSADDDIPNKKWIDDQGFGIGSGDITAVGSMVSNDAFADSTADDDWLGLGASAGRIEFDDQATDEVNILNANVGIGTDSPSDKLSVYTSKTATSTATPDSINLGGTYSDTAGTNLKLKLYDDGTSVGGFGISSGQVDYATWGSTADHVFYQGTTELMRIEGTGNVGIGTASPGRLLHVDGAMRLTSASTPSSPVLGDVYTNTDGNLYFYNGSSWDDLTVGTGSGDITAVGDVISGAAFTATAGDDGSTLYFEGSTADGFEVALTSADPGSDVMLTLPAATDTLVGRATTDTLTNKTLTSPTITNIDMNNTDIGNVKTVTFNALYDNGSSGASKTIAWDNGQKQKVTLTGNCTFTFTAPDGTGNFMLMLIQDGTGGRTPTWPGTVKWPAGTAPTLTTTASAIDIISCFYDGTNYYCDSGLDFQ